MTVDITVPIKCSTVRSVRNNISLAFMYLFSIGLAAVAIFLVWMLFTWDTGIGEKVVIIMLIPAYVVSAYLFSPFKIRCIPE